MLRHILVAAGIACLAATTVSLVGAVFFPQHMTTSAVIAILGGCLVVTYLVMQRSFASAVGFVGFLSMILALPALAADGTVVIPWGDWVVGLAGQHATEILIGGMLVLFRKLPSSVYLAIQTLRVDHLLENAINAGLNAVAGAAKNKALTVDVGSKVLAEAMNYAVRNAPALVKWLGGESGLKDKIFARLDLAPEASAEKINTALVSLSR